MFRTLLGILLPALVGLPFTLWLPSWPARLAMAFLAGVVIITAGLIVAGVLGGFGWRGLVPIGLVWLAAAALVVRRSSTSIQTPVSWRPRWGWPAWVLLSLTALNVVTAMAYAVKTPISDWDVVKVWLPKAELIAGSGFKALAQSVYPDYPPLWPLHLYISNGGNGWVKLVPSAYLIATLVVIFEYVRPRAGPAMAGACLLVVSGVPYVWLPYGVNDLMSEIPTMAFVTASTIMLAEHVEQPSAARAAIASLAAIGTLWTRPEGFFHAFLIAAILIVAGWRLRRMRETVLPACAVVVAYLGWRIVVRSVFHYSGGLQANPSALGPATLLNSLSDVVRYAAANVGNPYLFGPALIAVAAVTLGLIRWRAFGIVGFVLVADLALGVATYIALPSTDVGEPLIWWLTTGFKRMVMHFIPLLYVAAALAIGAWWWQRPRVESAPTDGRMWRTGRSMLAATLALTSIGIVLSGYAAYRVGGPKTYDLSDMGPSHVYGAPVDYSIPGKMSIAMDGQSSQTVVFYLLNTGRRLPPLDNITGTLSRFSSRVEASGVAEEFMVSADGKVIGRTMAAPGSGPMTITGQIPMGSRILELSVRQIASGTATASWMQPTVERAGLWWAVEILLFAALGIAAACGTIAFGAAKVSWSSSLEWLNPGLVAIALVAAAAAQQAVAISALLIPSWSFAIRLLT